MKSQKHNQTELKELNVSVEKQVVEDFERMSKNTDMPLEELVVIALKKFRSSHSDYLKEAPKIE